MRKSIGFILGTAALLLTGCGTSEGPLAEVSQPPPAKPEPSLVQLLDRPRTELAELCERWTEKVQQQQLIYRQGQVRFELLPDVRLPLVLPVWQQAKYSSKVGFSLPPYAKEGERDNVLALHLARFGDVEAARQLADADVRERLASSQPGKNYPVEWARLAALMLQEAEFRLAKGDADAAQDLIKIHKEVRAALVSQARKGPLGAALLPRGWGVLRQAAAEWKKAGKSELAALAEAALASWGEAPPLTPALAPGATRAEAARLLGGSGQGRVILASSVRRALDLLSLPVPADNVEAVVTCFDTGDRLSELLLIYGSGMSQECPQPVQLAHRLEEHTAGEAVPGELPRRRYPLSGNVCEVISTPTSSFAGGIIRLGKAPAPAALPRDFGLVHLDRSFSLNRARLAGPQSGGQFILRDDKLLAGLRLPVPSAQRGEVILQRDPDMDLLASLTVAYKPVAQRRTLAEVALPLWQALGASSLSGSAKESGQLVLTWEDRNTRYALHLPNAEEAVPKLVIADRAEGDALRKRAELVRAHDHQERRERLQKQQPWARLSRQLEQVQLGQTRAEVLAHLPPGEDVLRHELSDGLLVTFLGAPTKSFQIARELFVHFGPAGQVDEVRGRYSESKAGANRAYLKSLWTRFGAPEENVPKTGTRLASFTWKDDLTYLRCKPDSSGLDVILRDWPADRDAPSAPPAAYLPRGPADCMLGMARSDLLRKWRLDAKTSANPIVLTPTEGPHDALLCWVEKTSSGKQRVVRIVARHKQLAQADAAKAVATAWGRQAAVLGWPRRQEARSWSTHDDCTEVRLFWQQNAGEVPRIYSEWRTREEK
jgi:hypothetical protein